MGWINGRYVKTKRPRSGPTIPKTGYIMGAQHWDFGQPGMADWQYLTPEQIERLETAVRKVGFSWNSVYDRTGMSMAEMNGVRRGTRPFAWDTWMGYLDALVAAIEAVPVPARPAFVPEGMAPVIPPAPSVTIETVASTLGQLFLEAEKLDPTERDAAQDAYSRVAEALGIEAAVATVVRTRGPIGKSATVARAAGMLRDTAA